MKGGRQTWIRHGRRYRECPERRRRSLKEYAKPTTLRLKDQEADGTPGDDDRMC